MRKESATTIELLSYLKPFSPNLWLMVLGACVLASISLCLLEKHDNDSLQERSIPSAGVMSLWYSIGTVMGYGVDYHVKTAAGRLLTIGLYLLCLVLVASYTANLASDLTIKKSQSIIEGLDDIKKGKISFNRIGILSGSAHVDFYLREVSNGNRNFYAIKNIQHLYDSLFLDTIDAAFIAMPTGQYVTNNIYCNLTIVGQGFNKGVIGIVTPKQWLYAKDLDVNILALREAGVLENLRVKWFESRTCPATEEESTAMGIDSMSGLFLTFAIIWILSLLVFLWKKRFICKKCRCLLKLRKRLFFKGRIQRISPPNNNQNSLSSPSNI
ncbi:hypothetical protein I4U23_031492 [Adineta vaga]|nr:hypothetical protein I4U23_031492 [Adineta vaga]